AEARISEAYHAAEIAVAAADRRALFADLTLAITGLGGNVVGAQVFTSEAGQALDVFYLQDAAGEPYGRTSPQALARLTAALEAAAGGETPTFEERRPLDAGRGAAFKLTPTVILDNDASEVATIVEAS